MKILLADDHSLFIEGLKSLLKSRGYEKIATAANGHEAIKKAQDFRPDIILMDVYMPECNGLEATQTIKTFLPECKIIMLTSAETEANLFNAIKSGASGYLIKNLEAVRLFDLLDSLNRGEALLSPQIADKILKEYSITFQDFPSNHNTIEPKPILSSRHAEILSLVAQGITYKEIGVSLGLAERTIKYHMGRILDILHVDTRSQAIRLAMVENILE